MQPQEFNAIIDYLKKIEERTKDLDLKEAPYHSTQTKELFIALAKAQGEFPASIEQTSTNPHFKSGYATLDDIVRKIRPILARNGLSITQEERMTSRGNVVLHTRLHFEDQWTEVRAPIRPEKENIQGYGSALSYAKRYSLMSLLMITTSNDPDDDDGETNMRYARLSEAEQENKKITAGSAVFGSLTLNQGQIDIVERMLYKRSDIAERLFDKYSDLMKKKITSVDQLPESHFHEICAGIKKNIENNPR